MKSEQFSGKAKLEFHSKVFQSKWLIFNYISMVFNASHELQRGAPMMYRKPRERAQQIIFNWMIAHKNTHTHAREHTWEMSSRSVLACDECALRANYQTHDHQMCTLSVFFVCCVTNNLFCWAHCFFNLLFVCFFFLIWFQCEISSARCIWKFCECDAKRERKWSMPMEPIKLTAKQHTIR